MKKDAKENYNEDGILVVGENEICCYNCVNFEMPCGCLAFGKVKSVVSTSCEVYVSIDDF